MILWKKEFIIIENNSSVWLKAHVISFVLLKVQDNDYHMWVDLHTFILLNI